MCPWRLAVAIRRRQSGSQKISARTNGFSKHDQPFQRLAARGCGDGGAALVPALGEMPVREQAKHAQPAGGDYFGGL
ncbi:MAG: hypothetical protein K0U78_19145 [Actinomycetia bacterium]|nr:hypothetical protein [Actinomycetes bacterium]